MAGRLPVRANLVKLDRAARRLLPPVPSGADDGAGAVVAGDKGGRGCTDAPGAFGVVGGAGTPCCKGKLGAAGGGELAGPPHPLDVPTTFCPLAFTEPESCAAFCKFLFAVCSDQPRTISLNSAITAVSLKHVPQAVGAQVPILSTGRSRMKPSRRCCRAGCSFTRATRPSTPSGFPA
jgi:hypothetical protein